ncbi:MAG: NAD(P)/FAD-dependent oxidoreductase [Myxococcota bacterium]
MTERRRVVVIGGGFGGMRVAQGLRRAKHVEVTLIDKENHHLFQPLLYQVATAGLGSGSIAVPIRSVFRTQKNVRTFFGEVERIDFGQRLVHLKDGGEAEYDDLVIAVGAETNYFGNDHWSQFSYGLKSIRDAIGIREKILLAFEEAERYEDPAKRRELLSFVVVGGGPTGVEMAGAISELGHYVLAGDYRRIQPEEIRVVLVEMADHVLSPFSMQLRLATERMLRELKVELRLGSKVLDVKVDCVELEDETVPASVVVWAAGVKPMPFLRDLDLETTKWGHIVVDSTCRVRGHEHVYAIGDCACFVDEESGEPLPGVAPVAIQQGKHVAKLLAKRTDTHTPSEPFRYLDKGIMATVGRSRAVLEYGALKMKGYMAWLAWGFVHILYLIGFRNRFIVFFNWSYSYWTFKRGVRLVTGLAARMRPGRIDPKAGPRVTRPTAE